MDIRQSDLYASYMSRIGWLVEDASGVKAFIKKFPLVGSVIKVQRPNRVPSEKLINELATKYNARSISIENKLGVSGEKLEVKGFKVNHSPYLPTKTIQIDLTVGEDEIFQRLTEAKRRAVRRAIKNKIIVKESNNIEEFIKLKAKDFWPLGFLMRKDVKTLWESFRPKNAAVLIGHDNDKPVAGVFLLFYDDTAYYWMATSTKEGKKLFAPTLLVWEALKLAKKKGSTIFDFEGVYDERFAKATKKWKGFTKYKEGFGGKEVIFPAPIVKYFHRAF